MVRAAPGDDVAGGVLRDAGGDEQAVVDHGAGRLSGGRAAEAVFPVGGAQVLVGAQRVCAFEAQLRQAVALADDDRERAGDDLEPELSVVAGGYPVERVAVVGEDAGEDVEASGGALRVRLAAQRLGEVQHLLQADQVDAVALEDGRVAQLDVSHAQLGELVRDAGGRSGEEAGLDAVGGGAEAQVEAGGLVLLLAYRVGHDDAAFGGQLAQLLHGQHAACGFRGVHGKGLMGHGAWPAAKRSSAAIASSGVMRSSA